MSFKVTSFHTEVINTENIVNIFLIAFMFKLYIINCFHSGSMSKYIITESDFCLFFQDKYLYDTFAQHIC